MGVEIERKFLVLDDSWRTDVTSSMRLRQGYLTADEDLSIRVRLADDAATLTVKKRISDARRFEFEYEIPAEDAHVLLDHVCGRRLIEKTRHRLDHAGTIWEIDVFEGVNEGLVVAEVELDHEKRLFKKPPWAGKEVTDDSRYYNASLVSRPFRDWPGSDS